jgi:mRNA interferase RelE/StbE
VAYRLAHTDAALRELQALPRAIFRRVDAHILALANNPRPPGVQRLQGSRLWRLRVGDYRIIFAIDDAQQLVTIARVRHRGDAYRGL